MAEWLRSWAEETWDRKRPKQIIKPNWYALVDRVYEVALEAERRGLIRDAKVAMTEALDHVDTDQPYDTVLMEWLRAMGLERLYEELRAEEAMTIRSYDEMALEDLKRQIEEYGRRVVTEREYAKLREADEKLREMERRRRELEERVKEAEDRKRAFDELVDVVLAASLKEAGFKPAEIERVKEEFRSKFRYTYIRNLSPEALKREVEEYIGEVRRAAAERRPPPPPPKPKVVWTKELERRLRDIFEATLTREGVSPARFLPEFRLELETIRTLPTKEEMERAVEVLAREIAMRERAPRVEVRLPRPTVPEAAPPPMVEAPPPAVPVVPPAKPPAVPLSVLPFPRRLASEEIKAFYDAFAYELASAGLDPEQFIEYFNRFRDAWHSDWFHVLRRFKEMIDDIKAGKAPRLYPRPLMPLPWKNLPRDAILHLLATKVPQSMDDLIAQLNMHGVYVMPQEVILIVKDEWKKTPRDSWLEVTPRDYIKKILGVDPEDP
jgi:hypothetical protein